MPVTPNSYKNAEMGQWNIFLERSQWSSKMKLNVGRHAGVLGYTTLFRRLKRDSLDIMIKISDPPVFLA